MNEQFRRRKCRALWEIAERSPFLCVDLTARKVSACLQNSRGCELESELVVYTLLHDENAEMTIQL
jgi:hypothetical protein